MEEVVLGGGCFWCTEAAFKEVEGVEKVTSGYSGGHTEDPTYEEVCTGETGHAEVIKIEYEESVIELNEILQKFFKIHDPTTENRQGPDEGSQYRSVILYQGEEQKQVVQDFIESVRSDYEDEIVTEVKELDNFCTAEEKHQDYFEKHPYDVYCRMHAKPKVDKLKEDN